MVKSSAPVFILLFAFLFKLEKPTWTLTGVISIICLGVLLMVMEETHFEWSGYVQVQTATILSGFRWSITQILLERESLGMSNPLATSIFLAPSMSVCLLLASILTEDLGAMATTIAEDSTGLVFFILLGGFIAFLMVMAEFKLISSTGVVTFSIAGIFKEIITIVTSTILFGDTFTTMNLIGLLISLFGIGLYNYVRIVHMKKGSHHHHHGSRSRHATDGGDGESIELSSSSTRAGLLSEQFFDVDAGSDDEEPAIYGAGSAGLYGYHPVTTVVGSSLEHEEGQTTEVKADA
jgi:drug/metabolite transporter (DMT)-like permease